MLIDKMSVGSCIYLRIPCMGNEAGTKAVCFETYSIGEMRGVQLLFPNGEYCGFSEEEVEKYFYKGKLDFEPSVSGYEFVNVIKLTRDFRKGEFKQVWS